MKVKLLKNVLEADRFGRQTIKITPARAESKRTQLRTEMVSEEYPHGKIVELVERAARTEVVWVAGAVIDMSDASAAKYIERGDAEAYTETAAA